VCGFVWALVRRSRIDRWFGVSLALTTAFLFLLSLGEFAAYAPASLAHHLPLFSSFRIPSRYTIPFLHFAALTLAWAFQSTLERSGLSQTARIVVAAAALAASAHLIYVNQWNLRRVFTEAPFDTSFHWLSGPRQIGTLADASPYTPGSPMLRALMEDRSFYTCYESLQLAHGSVADRPQVFDADSGGRVTGLDFSPNVLTFSVNDGAGDARVLLNQNWAPGWTSDRSELAAPPQTELASVVIPAKESGRLSFSFRPPLLVTGLIIFDLALIATLTMWRRRTQPLIS